MICRASGAVPLAGNEFLPSVGWGVRLVGTDSTPSHFYCPDSGRAQTRVGGPSAEIRKTKMRIPGRQYGAASCCIRGSTSVPSREPGNFFPIFAFIASFWAVFESGFSLTLSILGRGRVVLWVLWAVLAKEKNILSVFEPRAMVRKRQRQGPLARARPRSRSEVPEGRHDNSPGQARNERRPG